MFNNIRARILKMCEMSWEDLRLLKLWSKFSTSFNSFDVESFNASSLRIAVATNEHDQPIVFCPIENVLMISAYAVSPQVSPKEAQIAGDYLDSEVARLAQQQGIKKMLIVVPNDYPALPDEEYQQVRVYTRKIPQSVAMGRVTFTDNTATVNSFIN